MAEDDELIDIPLRVEAGADGRRLDRYLSLKFARLSRNRIHTMIGRGRVRLADTGRVLKKSARVREGQSLVVSRPAPEEPPVTLDYAVIHQDEALLVIDKPSGLPVHPSARYHHHTLTALMRTRLGQGHGWEMAHRLDRETSGVMFFGRLGSSGPAIKRAFFRREIDKEYLAIARGTLEEAQTIRLPLGPHRNSKILVKVGHRPVADGGREAHTVVKPLAHGSHRGAAVTLVHCRLYTGRTHQIRAHLELVGHPLLGDKIYGAPEAGFLDVVERGRPVADYEAELGLGRHALHCWRMGLNHPEVPREATDENSKITFSASWPQELAAVLDLPVQVPPLDP